MTCFNPKYAEYTYGPIYETKHFKRQIGERKIKDNNGKIIKIEPIIEKVYYKTGKHRIGKRIHFIPKANFDPKELGNGQTIIPCGKCLGCR